MRKKTYSVTDLSDDFQIAYDAMDKATRHWVSDDCTIRYKGRSETYWRQEKVLKLFNKARRGL